MRSEFIELFCGAGLLGHAFERAGFEPVLAIDRDQDAIDSYNLNSRFPVAKLHDVKETIERHVDLIVAGPPCQGFSSLGSRNENDTRNLLSLEIANWAKYCKPKLVVIENVPQFLKSKHKKILDQKMQELGYIFEEWTLDASDFGAAQNRKRAFCIYSKSILPKKPTKTLAQKSVADAFSDLTEDNGDPLHFAPPISKLAMKRIKNIPENGSKIELLERKPELCPPSWKRMGRQAVDVWGRMHLDKPSNTIRCNFQNPSKGRYIHPYLNRVITLREGARLQGVPDEWRFVGARTSITRQIGNGVPIPLGMAVAKAITSAC